MKTLTKQDKNQTVKVMDAVVKKNSARHQHEWFARDAQHPDRNGHQLLYNEVVKRIFEVNEWVTELILPSDPGVDGYKFTNIEETNPINTVPYAMPTVSAGCFFM